jgi:uncharacterized iron-regulated membrane protein
MKIFRSDDLRDIAFRLMGYTATVNDSLASVTATISDTSHLPALAQKLHREAFVSTARALGITTEQVAAAYDDALCGYPATDADNVDDEACDFVHLLTARGLVEVDDDY